MISYKRSLLGLVASAVVVLLLFSNAVVLADKDKVDVGKMDELRELTNDVYKPMIEQGIDKIVKVSDEGTQQLKQFVEHFSGLINKVDAVSKDIKEAGDWMKEEGKVVKDAVDKQWTKLNDFGHKAMDEVSKVNLTLLYNNITQVAATVEESVATFLKQVDKVEDFMQQEWKEGKEYMNKVVKELLSYNETVQHIVAQFGNDVKAQMVNIVKSWNRTNSIAGDGFAKFNKVLNETIAQQVFPTISRSVDKLAWSLILVGAFGVICVIAICATVLIGLYICLVASKQPAGKRKKSSPRAASASDSSAAGYNELEHGMEHVPLIPISVNSSS